MAAADGQVERLYQIYDALRTVLLNKKYYAARLSRYQSYNLLMEIFIAVGATGSGVAGFAVWQMNGGKFVWGVISGASIILAIVKPLLRLTERVEGYAKLYGEYTSAFERMKILVDDIQIERALSSSAIRLFQQLRTRVVELSKLGDPHQNRNLVRRLQSEVNMEIPVDSLWGGIDSETPAHPRILRLY
jgi:hypothetical protein